MNLNLTTSEFSGSMKLQIIPTKVWCGCRAVKKLSWFPAFLSMFPVVYLLALFYVILLPQTLPPEESGHIQRKS